MCRWLKIHLQMCKVSKGIEMLLQASADGFRYQHFSNTDETQTILWEVRGKLNKNRVHDIMPKMWWVCISRPWCILLSQGHLKFYTNQDNRNKTKKSFKIFVLYGAVHKIPFCLWTTTRYWQKTFFCRLLWATAERSNSGISKCTFKKKENGFTLLSSKSHKISPSTQNNIKLNIGLHKQ